MIDTARKEGPQPPVETVRPRPWTVLVIVTIVGLFAVATAARGSIGNNTSRKQRNGTKTEEHLGLVLVRGGTFIRRRAEREAAQAGAEIVRPGGRWHRGAFLHRQTRFHHRLQEVDEQLGRLHHHVVLWGVGRIEQKQRSITGDGVVVVFLEV